MSVKLFHDQKSVCLVLSTVGHYDYKKQIAFHWSFGTFRKIFLSTNFICQHYIIGLILEIKQKRNQNKTTSIKNFLWLFELKVFNFLSK